MIFKEFQPTICKIWEKVRTIRLSLPIPRKKHIVLHVGHHKTGSSAIQSFLALNEQNLAQHGFYYPTSRRAAEYVSNGYPSAGNAHFLAGRVKGAAKRTPIMQILRNLKTGRRLTNTKLETVILSSETLTECSKFGLLQLKNMFPRSSFHVVFYIRDQAAFLTSQYQQTVKLGHETHSLEEFFRNSGFAPERRYPRIIRKLRNVFGAENVTVRVYDRDYFPNGDIISDFCSSIGISNLDGWNFPGREINTSLTELEVSILRELRQFFDDRWTIWEVAQGLQQVRARFDHDINEHLNSAPFCISRAAYEIACEKFAEENELLNRKFLKRTPIRIKKPRKFFEGPRPTFSPNEKMLLLLLASHLDLKS